MLQDIPGPPGYPIFENIFDVRNEIPINGLINLADKYGPIYKVTLYGQVFVVVNSVRLLEELSDETRFHKVLSPGLESIKTGKASGLFASSSEDDPDWGQAHRILMPAFGPLAITNMFDEMYEIAMQLVAKWSREPEHIQATEDFTRLTLDSIALCAMDYRFNSFYHDDLHPFVKAMTRSLGAGNGPSTIFGILSLLTTPRRKGISEDRVFMESIANELVQNRRNHPTDKKDLLNAMINGKDPKTGERMRDDLITANMTTFLVAGHETTSGLLSFALAYLLKTPTSLQTAKAEVDKIVGQGRVQIHHLKEMKYLNAVLRETLRLNPTVPAYVRQIRPDYQEPSPSLGGYAINRDWKIYALVSKTGKDPDVYGEDANEFRPERMLEGQFEQLPQSAWKPFGTGIRACIGRAFAWQEALLAMTLSLQHFDIRLEDPHYEIRVKQTLTVKPRDLYIRVTPRKTIDTSSIPESVPLNGHGPHVASHGADNHKSTTQGDDTSELLVLFGSNTGTCQTLAQRLAADAPHHGYSAKVADMDSGIADVQKASKVVVITASYEGQPPDNAAHFIEWLEAKSDSHVLESLEYAVFGCGHSDWAATFLRIPVLVDKKLEQMNGKRIAQMGHSDAAHDNIFGEFDEWTDSKFWPAITELHGKVSADNVTSKLDFEIHDQDRASQLRQDVKSAIVKSTKVLTAAGEPEKRHIEILLPSGMAYEPGDYLTVLPLNPDFNVHRVMARYHIPWDATIIFKANGPIAVPIGTPISVMMLLKGYVELAQPATKKDIRRLADSSSDAETKTALQSLLHSQFEPEVTKKHTSIIDLLEQHPQIDLQFADLLSLLPPMRIRYYSISSSPLADPTLCSITCGVISTPSLSATDHPFTGVAGSYLQSLQPGDSIHVAVRSSTNQFRLPLRPNLTPMIMFCAGTGIAPFRGFIQQRAEMIKAGNTQLAAAVLFVGCRSSTRDRLYAEEMDEWSRLGAVDVRYAFSHQEEETDRALSAGCKYVQDRMWESRERVYEMWDLGAKIFVCGSPGMAKAVGGMARALVRERMRVEGRGADNGDGEEERGKMEEWFERQRGERFVTDVFG